MFVLSIFSDYVSYLEVHRKNEEEKSNEVLKIESKRYGLQSFIDDFDTFLKQIFGEETIGKFKSCELDSYLEIQENFKLALTKKGQGNIGMSIPFSLCDLVLQNNKVSLNEAIDMSIYAEKVRFRNGRMIWKKAEDFWEIFGKTCSEITADVKKVVDDVKDIGTIILFGSLTTYWDISNALEMTFSTTFSTKRIVHFSMSDVLNGALFIGHMQKEYIGRISPKPGYENLKNQDMATLLDY